MRFLKFFVIVLYVLLIFKDPFSQRTLIPNLEPYPDTFHYINPALNLVRGIGFNLNREGRVVTPSVPPLYTLSLVPLYLIKSDPRMAYYTNVLLALISLLLFWTIIKKITENKLTIFLLLMLYTTNYFIYWVSSLVMAENLTLTLALTAIYLLLSKVNILNSVLIASVGVGLYATKLANIPITTSLAIIYLAKILIAKLILRQKVKVILVFLASLSFCFLIFGFMEHITKGNNLFYQVAEHVISVYKSFPQSGTQVGFVSSTSSSSWFGIEYISHNLPLYIRSLIGQPNRFLWDNTPLVPSFIGIGGLIGILIGLLKKESRLIAVVLGLFILTSVFFMSTFYTFDARYIYITIPILIIGFGLFLTTIVSKILKHKFAFNVLILIILLFYLVTNFERIKSQISLNLRYAETPWNYISVLKANDFFTPDKVHSGKKPILISALPPFLVDYYSNNNYTLLPLSYEQEFRDKERRQTIWGMNDYSNLPKLYEKYLNEGFAVYVSRAGLGNEGYTNHDFNTIVKEFDTKLVLQGCYDQCNIYSVKLKDKNGK